MNKFARYYRNTLRGPKTYPRGLVTNARQNEVFAVEPYTFWRRANDNPMIGFMEGLQCIAGVFDHAAIAQIAPGAKLDLFTKQSAYGPRIGLQLDEVISALMLDAYSRRAVIILAEPEEPFPERPCTTSMQFQIDPNGRLIMTVSMRSSDAVWGLTYDIIQFNMVGHVVADCIVHDCEFGQLVINIGNGHVYEDTKLDKPNFAEHSFALPSKRSLSEWRAWAKYHIGALGTKDAKARNETFSVRTK